MSLKNDMAVELSSYLNYHDFISFMNSNEDFNSLLETHKTYNAPHVIRSFLIKSLYIKNKINKKINIIPVMGTPILNSKEWALYYFFEYPTEFTDSWVDAKAIWKKNIIQSYQFQLPEGQLNKYDLFHIQYKMNPEDILNIGW